MRGTPRQIADELRKRISSCRKELRTQESRNVKQVVYLAQQASLGPYKALMLAAMGHPYSRRRPFPPIAAGIINFQSGELYRSWRSRGPKLSNGDMVSRVFNTSPHAKEVETGGKYAIARPTARHVGDQIRPIRIASLQRVVRRTLKTS